MRLHPDGIGEAVRLQPRDREATVESGAEIVGVRLLPKRQLQDITVGHPIPTIGDHRAGQHDPADDGRRG